MKRIVLAAVVGVGVAFGQITNAQIGGPTAAPGNPASAKPPAAGNQKEKAQKKQVKAKANRIQAALKQPAVAPAPAPSIAKRKPNANRGDANTASNKPISYSDALQRCVRERHDRNWWKQRYTTIVLVGAGYYYWDAGYWFPAWGYDPAYDYYDYNGPIYTYGNLLPDQVILNVQRALQQIGYYSGRLTGSLGSATRQAIAAFQQDYGLVVTAAIDAPTVEALGLE